MGNWGPILRRIILVAYLVGVHLIAAAFLVGEFRTYFTEGIEHVQDPTARIDVPSPITAPEVLADLNPSMSAPGSGDTSLELIVPVAGITADQLSDTFDDVRGSDERHDAIDISAPAGTPVVAAADGVIIRFFDSVAGGITIYQLSTDQKYVYYYAHLQRRSDEIKVGDKVIQGQVIGFVGDSGNAVPGNYHLHFSVAAVRDPVRYWEGEYVNPFQFMKKSLP